MTLYVIVNYSKPQSLWIVPPFCPFKEFHISLRSENFVEQCDLMGAVQGFYDGFFKEGMKIQNFYVVISLLSKTGITSLIIQKCFDLFSLDFKDIRRTKHVFTVKFLSWGQHLTSFMDNAHNPLEFWYVKINNGSLLIYWSYNMYLHSDR